MFLELFCFDKFINIFLNFALCAILQFCALLSYCYGDNENRALQCKGKVQFLVTSISERYRTGRTHILPQLTIAQWNRNVF